MRRALPAQATGIWAELCALKTVVAEPRGAGADLDLVMRQYYAAVASGGGGLFLAVCRGKASRRPPCGRPRTATRGLSPCMHGMNWFSDTFGCVRAAGI